MSHLKFYKEEGWEPGTKEPSWERLEWETTQITQEGSFVYSKYDRRNASWCAGIPGTESSSDSFCATASHLAQGGKLAESSDKSERGEPGCPKIHPNFSWVKVRTRFPQSDSWEKNRSLFQRKDAIQIFIHCLSRVRFWCAMSSMVSTLSEDSAQFPMIGANLSEDSPNLPLDKP